MPLLLSEIDCQIIQRCQPALTSWEMVNNRAHKPEFAGLSLRDASVLLGVHRWRPGHRHPNLLNLTHRTNVALSLNTPAY